MFEHTKSHRCIVVTGPQRSGTTICAKMIAHDTGHQFVDEAVYGVHCRQAFEAIVRYGLGVVVQAPTMCRYVHKLPKDVLIVLMIRDFREIYSSENRIGLKTHSLIELGRYGLNTGDAAAIKYDYWRNTQRGMIEHKLEVEYASLSAHPLWLPAKLRENFLAKQTDRPIDSPA